MYRSLELSAILANLTEDCPPLLCLFGKFSSSSMRTFKSEPCRVDNKNPFPSIMTNPKTIASVSLSKLTRSWMAKLLEQS